MTDDLLTDDHAEVDALFRELASAFDRGDARVVFERLDYLWARLAVHIRAEHLHLFPALLAASAKRGLVRTNDAPSADEVRAAVERLREDHDFFMRELAAAVNAARELAAQDVPTERERLMQIKGRASAVAARLVEHNRTEERKVYPWPEALLDGSELEAMRAGMRREIEDLPPRFSEGATR
ncbi:MAG TPA: hemerythrin domain-containing protein [Pyrinomonadaceae bacterium]|nr:hemerythrin domain-containing protein [Pyrinomonadaceae bacterium]